MVKKLLLFLVSFLCSIGLYAQVGQGALKGKITDKANKEPIPFANIIVQVNGSLVTGGTTDFDGKFEIKPISPGKYDITVKYVGYQDKTVNGVVVNSDKTSFIDIQISQGIDLNAVEIVDYEVPLISKDQTSTGGTVTREAIAKMPGRSAESVAITVGGIFSSDGERGSIRGARDNSTDTYVDGIKVRGSSNIPNSAIEQVSVILGGLPAQYGDATGGVISITTRGPSSKYFGGAEFVTSRFTDFQNYNLLAGSISGPLLMRKDPTDPTRKKPLLGFFLATELRYEEDPRPSAIGTWKAKDSLLDFLQQNPLRETGTGFGAFANADYVRARDIQSLKTRQDVAERSLLLQGKIDLVTSSTTNFTVGGNIDIGNSRTNGVATGGYGTTVYNNMLFNSANNPDIFNNTWRVYGRFTQRFNNGGQEDKSASIIKNIYYTIQADYSKVQERAQDKTHKENFFNYGYVGRFEQEISKTYEYKADTVMFANGVKEVIEGFHMDAFRNDRLRFTPGTANPFLANYTNRYYQLYDEIEGNYQNPEQIQSGNGLLNGEFPGSIYSLWTSPGVPYNTFRKVDNSMFRVVATGSADIKDHQLLIGFEFEQRDDRSFALNPAGLWRRARQLMNAHILQLNLYSYENRDNYVTPEFNYVGSTLFLDYQRQNPNPGDYQGGDSQYFFDYNVRKALGLNTDGLDYVDIGAFDPNMLDIKYFSADELLNFGNNVASYYGYDHTGNKLKNRPSFDDFFTAEDEFGNKKREIGSFQPNYMAFYVQDKFTFDDLVFNLGVRVDRYDANQPVLKDPFSIPPTRKAGEGITAPEGGHPSNIGDDYVVYVADVSNPSANSIIGYRNGDQWYNAQGQLLADPSSLRTSQGFSPWLVNVADASNYRANINSSWFTDYKPQINVMPRVAFSFPISDEALFFAHYDILTTRPRGFNRLDPTDYLFLLDVTSPNINNPDLKPEKTIEYEMGFQQKLSSSSSLKLSTFYRELRDMIQIRYMTGAYPREYLSYSNLDFGTVKGLTLTYDLRRTKNLTFRANYTLQFADATGSGATTGTNLVQNGYGNLRSIFPLDFDRRHAIQTTIDYRYGSGRDYNGPIVMDKQILANTGVNIVLFGGSGSPFTRNSNVTLQADNVGDRGIVKGSVNGSRLPWQFRMDLRLDRDITLSWGKEDNKKTGTLNVYIIAYNALNSLNILNVYSATGSPSDDGYLAEAQFQENINTQNSPEAFRELYAMKINNPTNYALPRRIRLGVIFNF